MYKQADICREKKTDASFLRMCKMAHVLEQKEFFFVFFFQISVPRCWWEVKPEFIHSLKFQKDISNERNSPNCTDK